MPFAIIQELKILQCSNISFRYFVKLINANRLILRNGIFKFNKKDYIIYSPQFNVQI